MTSTDRLAEACSERSVAVASEIERQGDPRDKLALAQHAILAEAIAEIDRLRTRIVELDRIIAERTAEAERLKAEYAVTYGSFRAAVLDEPDEPATITHDIPPNAPR